MTHPNPNSRLEAFSDGVFAIALTLLIIEIRPPAPDTIRDTAGLWRALAHMAPAVGAFLLSFIIILITWVNHHAAMTLINKSSPHFIYANGLLLLTVVFVPFPTALVGEFLLTDHAAPAVVLYDSVLALQAVGWLLLLGAVEGGHLATSDKAASTLRTNRRYSYYAFALYAFCAGLAVWFPLASAAVTTVTWIFWLMLSIAVKPE
jgi:uncharacterized membrane protein